MRSPLPASVQRFFGLRGGVVGDHGVRRVEDRLRAAVVLVEHDRGDLREGLLELQDVAVVGAAEAIDRVVHEHAAGDVRVRRRRPPGRRPRSAIPRVVCSTVAATNCRCCSTTTSIPGRRCDIGIRSKIVAAHGHPPPEVQPAGRGRPLRVVERTAVVLPRPRRPIDHRTSCPAARRRAGEHRQVDLERRPTWCGKSGWSWRSCISAFAATSGVDAATCRRVEVARQRRPPDIRPTHGDDPVRLPARIRDRSGRTCDQCPDQNGDDPSGPAERRR